MNNSDQQHLKLLVIFHYVVAAIAFAFGCFPFIHVAIGIAMINGAFSHGRDAPPEAFGWFFVIIGLFIIAWQWLLACLIVSGGRCLSARRRYIFCMVVAGFECLLMPFGTVLGVFTIVVLLRPSVKAMFDPNYDPATAKVGLNG